jgi:hypothetical protein
MQEISIVITMDCEPTLETTHPSATGPKDFALSERAIVGYFETAMSYGFPVTYFVHPETILVQAGLFKDLAARGACIGLHIHPWKYSQWRNGGTRYMAHLGQLSYQEQVALFSETLALWQQAMGERPLYFRPGTFSANDATFRALLDTGFLGGSISAPGRIYRDIRAVWTGAEPDPHRPSADFRMMPGDMLFGNMPLSSDYSHFFDMGSGRCLYPDFRPDVDWLKRFDLSYRTMADNTLSQVVARNPKVPVINAISHNQYDYSEPSTPENQRYHTLLDELAAACARANIKPVGATVGDIVKRVLDTEPVQEEFRFI